MSDPLAEVIADALSDPRVSCYLWDAESLGDDPNYAEMEKVALHASATHVSSAIAAALRAHPDAVLEALGYERVGWAETWWPGKPILTHNRTDPRSTPLFARKADPDV